MNDNKLISVIVPVYNAEQHLERCINSILAQSYTNLEVILINDGSTDRSGEICDSYKNVDSRVKVLHKINGGQASARNEGLRIATGEFIGFVDDDDVIDTFMYEILYKNIQKYNTDVSGIIADWIYTSKKVCESEKYESRFYSSDELIFNMLAKQKIISSSVWDKLFRSSLFNDIKFPDGCEYEDYWVIIKILEKVQGIYIETRPLYHWYQYESSQSKRGFHRKSYSYVTISKKIRDELMVNNYPSYILDAATYFVLISYIKFFGKAFRAKNLKIEASDLNLTQIKKDLRIEITEAKENKYISKSIKAKCYILSSPFCGIYKKIWIIKNAMKKSK